MKLTKIERALDVRPAMALVAALMVSSIAFVQTADAANPAPAPASQAPAAPDQSAAGASPRWTKTCETNPQSKQQICITSQEIWLNTDGSARASFSVQVRSDKKVVVAAMVPLTFIIPAGVQVTVDGNKKGVMQFIQCNPPVPSQGTPAGCLVVGDGNDDLVSALHKGTKMALVLTNGQNQQLPLELPLAGFGTAFDGAGMDPQAAAKARIETSKSYTDVAKEMAKRLKDQQNQATGAPATQN